MVKVDRARNFGTVVLSGLVVAAALATTPQPAAAQGFFGALFGGFDRGPRHEERRFPQRQHHGDPRARAYAPNQNFPFPEWNSRRAEPRAAAPAQARARSATVHCVRLCDGRFFPVPRSSGNVRLDPAKVCSALCPAAETKVFNGSDMNHARASDGTRYASLDTAFAFRERLVPDCSCTGQGPGGLAQIDVESDPTLRAGDIVVTADGPTVFRGSRQFPYQSADFTPVDDYERLNRSVRTTLADLQVNTGVAPVVPPQRLEPSTPQRPARAAQRPAAQQGTGDEVARRRAIQPRRQAQQRQLRQQQVRQQQLREQQARQQWREAQRPSLFRLW